MEEETPAQTRPRPTKKNSNQGLGLNLISAGGLKHFRDRLLSNGFEKDSDVDAYLSAFSNFDQELVSGKKRNIQNLNYMTATGDEAGITQQEESATDNDFEFKNILNTLGQKQTPNQQM